MEPGGKTPERRAHWERSLETAGLAVCLGSAAKPIKLPAWRKPAYERHRRSAGPLSRAASARPSGTNTSQGLLGHPHTASWISVNP